MQVLRFEVIVSVRDFVEGDDAKIQEQIEGQLQRQTDDIGWASEGYVSDIAVFNRGWKPETPGYEEQP